MYPTCTQQDLWPPISFLDQLLRPHWFIYRTLSITNGSLRLAEPPGSQYASTPPHCSCHLTHLLNSQLLMTNGVGGVFLLTAHVTSTLNSWSPMGVGGEVWGPPPHCSCYFNSQLLITNGVGGGFCSLLMSPTKLIAAQQWNETDFIAVCQHSLS